MDRARLIKEITSVVEEVVMREITAHVTDGDPRPSLTPDEVQQRLDSLSSQLLESVQITLEGYENVLDCPRFMELVESCLTCEWFNAMLDECYEFPGVTPDELTSVVNPISTQITQIQNDIVSINDGITVIQGDVTSLENIVSSLNDQILASLDCTWFNQMINSCYTFPGVTPEQLNDALATKQDVLDCESFSEMHHQCIPEEQPRYIRELRLRGCL